MLPNTIFCYKAYNVSTISNNEFYYKPHGVDYDTFAALASKIQVVTSILIIIISCLLSPLGMLLPFSVNF